MIIKFLRGLAGGGESAPVQHEAVEYKGFHIVPSPRKTQGGWTTEGTISRALSNDERYEHFIRADVLMSEEEAVEYSVTKAKKIIDEQGERLLKG